MDVIQNKNNMTCRAEEEMREFGLSKNTPESDIEYPRSERGNKSISGRSTETPQHGFSPDHAQGKNETGIYHWVEMTKSYTYSIIKEVDKIAPVSMWEKKTKTIKDKIGRNPLWKNYAFERHSVVIEFVKLLHELDTESASSIESLTAERIRLLSFLASLLELNKKLSKKGQHRLAGMMRDGLKTDIGIEPLMYELKVGVNLVRRGYFVEFMDIESRQKSEGSYDLLAKKRDIEIEIECKHFFMDKGLKIHSVDLYDLFNLLPEASTFLLGREGCGQIVHVLLPGRLSEKMQQKREIANRITEILHGKKLEVNDHICRITVHEFPVDSAPFSQNLMKEADTEEVISFVKNRLNLDNVKMLICVTHRQEHTMICVESEIQNDVTQAILKDLKRSVKKQLTGNRLGSLSIHFGGLNARELSELSYINSDGSLTPIGGVINELMANKNNLYSVSLSAKGGVSATPISKGGREMYLLKEIIQSATIRNRMCSHYGCDLLKGMF